MWLVNNAGTDSPGDSMGDDEPQVGYRREWVPPAEDVLPCKALLLSCGGRSYIYSDDHRVQHEGAVPVSAGTGSLREAESRERV